MQAVWVQLRFFRIFQQNRGVDLCHIHLPHGPAAETTLADFFVLQKNHVFVATVSLDMTIQLADGVAAALYRLQKNAASVTQNASDAAGRVVLARLGQDGFNGFGLGVDCAAGVK